MKLQNYKEMKVTYFIYKINIIKNYIIYTYFDLYYESIKLWEGKVLMDQIDEN